MTHIAIIGGGPGGYQAAFIAADLGARVTLIEKEHFGGTCLNHGCVPTKTILRTAQLFDDMRRAPEFALAPVQPVLDLDQLRTRENEVMDTLRAQIAHGLSARKVEVVSGLGRMTGPKQVTVTLNEPDESGATTRVVDADAIIIATGSEPFRLPMIDHTLPRVWTSDEALELREIPSEIIICGGGVIGAEFASAYESFGSKVTIVELAPTLLPGQDKRITRTLEKAFKQRDINLKLKTSVESVRQEGERVIVSLSNGETIEADVLMSAVGRAPRAQGLGFEEQGIEFDRRAIKVNTYYETSLPDVYAVGDCIGGIMLAHMAEYECRAAVRNIMERAQGKEPTHSVPNELVPACVYTNPEIAMVGLSTEKAKEAEIDFVCGIAKFAGNAKALAEGETEGFVQILAERETGTILGAQMVGPHVVELIAEVANAMSAGTTIMQLAAAVYAHPVVSEVVMAAAEATVAKLA